MPVTPVNPEPPSVTTEPAFAAPGRMLLTNGQPGPALMLKFAFETSKNTLFTASTLMRAEALFRPAGTLMAWLPSLPVIANRTIGNVMPTSRDRAIFTLLQFTGATLVLLTLHVTVWVVPTGHVSPPLGAVTWNGPAPPATVSATWSSRVPPPPARLSRTVTRKFSV